MINNFIIVQKFGRDKSRPYKKTMNYCPFLDNSFHILHLLLNFKLYHDLTKNNKT